MLVARILPGSGLSHHWLELADNKVLVIVGQYLLSNLSIKLHNYLEDSRQS